MVFKRTHSYLLIIVLFIVTLVFLVTLKNRGESIFGQESVEKKETVNSLPEKPTLFSKQDLIADSNVTESPNKINLKAPDSYSSEWASLMLGNAESNLSVRERIALLNQKSSVSDEEIEDLYRFLGDRSNETGLAEDDFYWLKNDIMGFLRLINPSDETYMDRLTALFADADQDLVVRDYALQHSSVWAQENNRQSALEPLLRQGVHEKRSTIAGTALLAWNRVDIENMNATEIGEHAVRISRDADYSLESRVTALQVAASYDLSQSALIAEGIIRDNLSEVLLKISAIRVLSEQEKLQGPSPILQELGNNQEERLRKAVAANSNY